MSTLLFGTSRVVLTPVHGVRLEPVELSVRAHVLAQMRPLGSRIVASPPPPGREAPAAATRREILAYQPVEFHAPCGYGKTTLLRYLASGAVWAPAVYVRVGSAPLDDVLQMIFDQLFTAPEPVKPTRAECEQLIRDCRTLVVLDDVPPGSRIPHHLATVLTGYGHLVTSSVGPVLTGLGQSWTLPGLPADAAFTLFTQSLDRPILHTELPYVHRLLEAVAGQPLHIKQAAALLRAGEFTARRLTEEAEADPEALDRLSLSRLSNVKRRALAVLTLFAGTLLPAALVSGIGDISYVLQYLDALHRDGIAEHPDDRFGVPVCKKERYQQQLLGQIDLAAAIRGLAGYLADPSGPHAREGLEAALSLLGFASERAQWTAVVRLIQLVEPVLFVSGRWAQWRDVLGQGIEAAQQTGDIAVEALFSHQKGTLAYCENRLEEARELLERAVELRTRLGDNAGSALSRAHLRLVRPDVPATRNVRPSGRPRPGRARQILATLAGVVAIVAAARWAIAEASQDSGTEHPPPNTSSPATEPSTSTPTVGTETPSTGPTGVPEAEATPATLGFPETAVGTRSAPVTLTLTSTGTPLVAIEKAELGGTTPGDFEITEENCAAKELAPKGNCRIQVAFRPTATGSRTAELTITDNTVDGGRTIPLSAVGTAPPDLADLKPVINQIPALDDVALPTLEFIVENRGGGVAAPTTTTVTITKPGGVPVPQPSQATAAIQPGDSQQIEVDTSGCDPVTACEYTVIANADKAIQESDETNNKVTRPPDAVEPPDPVDPPGSVD
ncbi:choice-of-anchor D domain-containing protein [Streptomyces sp. NBC_00564]|uniref:choice-of-anchor D domain-containing protein n=1 Tax=Streptomyces sp. NBC_00564 TaxID=2903663 RepID=UPI002FCD6E0B|nr:choice-of-anchor D domain-containing protein [Streptomyces sp. NBC_00564]